MRYCEMCESMTKVVETRDTHKRTVTRRRRECLKCGHRFTTYELRGLAVVTTEREYIGSPAKMPTAEEIAAQVEVPTAEDIAGEIMYEIEERISDRLDSLPDDLVEALLAESDARRPMALPVGRGHDLELTADDVDEDEDD